jgi:hypothetical protein
MPPYSIVAYSIPPIPPQGTGIPYCLVPNEVYDSYLRRAPINWVQTMSHANPTAHHVTSTSHTPVNSKYEADFGKLKEDLASMMRTKLGVDMGSSRLYQKPYSTEFDLIPLPVGWC